MKMQENARGKCDPLHERKVKMKARTINARRLIAAYGLGEDKLGALAGYCDKQGIILRGVEPYEADFPVGFLCGFAGFAPGAGCTEPPKDECLIFSGFDRRALSEAVDGLKAAGVKVALKAVCTPSNQSWKLSDLIKELTREHEYMTGGGSK